MFNCSESCLVTLDRGAEGPEAIKLRQLAAELLKIPVNFYSCLEISILNTLISGTLSQLMLCNTRKTCSDRATSVRCV